MDNDSKGAGARFLLKRARRNRLNAANAKPWIGFHRWKMLNNAPWTGAWAFGRWAGFAIGLILGLPLLLLLLLLGFAAIVGTFSLLSRPESHAPQDIIGLVLVWIIVLSLPGYYLFSRTDDFGAGEPLSPKKRAAWRERKAAAAKKEI